jgi:cold shock CspA family protein/uncharacterized LabA/DUF88 family protein
MSKLTKIGIFYDGNYFFHVSNYYNYDHSRKKRLSISGLHQFIRSEVAKEEGTKVNFCQIVDAHYFRGRLSAQEASLKGDTLFWDRVFEDILMSEGITTHYLPLKTVGGKKEEKGIDVWFALEVYEQTLLKKFDVVVLIATDGDYVPLVRKLNTLGIRVMLLAWDFESTSEFGQRYITRTSQDLLEEVTYPIAMHEVIDNRLLKNEALINNLFVSSSESRRAMAEKPVIDYSTIKNSEILSLKNGYGFIKYPPNNLFFHFSNLKDVDFNDLSIGNRVSFRIVKNDNGEDVATDVQLSDEVYEM